MWSIVNSAVWYGCLILSIGVFSAGSALAQDNGNPPPTSDQQASNPHAGGFFDRDVLTGDWGGGRSVLESRGVQFGLNYIGEGLGNPTGGVRTGAIYDGRVEMLLNLDLDKVAGWSGATFHVNAYQINGRGLSQNDLDSNIVTVSNIEATRSTRLDDLWLQQQFADGAVSVRAGQIAADEEFFVSPYAGNFINSTFGFPGLTAVDLPSSGPVYPLATPGVRASVAPSSEWTLMGAVFNGNPAGPGAGNPQLRNASGTSFRVNDGVFGIAEAAYAVNQGKDDKGLAADYKLGGWYNSNSFADQRFDTMGVSLASPASNGIALSHHGDFGAYGVVDQMLWRDPDDNSHAVAVFLRLAGAPADRNLVSFYVDGGVNYLAPFPERPSDVAGLAVAYGGISSTASALDRDANSFTGLRRPIRDYEMAVELTYKAQVTPWWAVQPDLQVILHPAGHVSDPTDPTGLRPIRNAVVLGVRTAITF